MGIHYDYKSTKSAKLMEKQAKRERKLAEKKAKRLAKAGPKKSENKKVPKNVFSTFGLSCKKKGKQKRFIISLNPKSKNFHIEMRN